MAKSKMSHHVIHEMSDGKHTIEHHMAPKMVKNGMGWEHEEPVKHVMGSECAHCAPLKAAMGKEEEAEGEE